MESTSITNEVPLLTVTVDPLATVILPNLVKATPPDVVSEEEPLRVLALAVSGAVTDVNDVQSRDLLFSKLDDPNADIRVAAAYYFGRVTDTSLWSSGVSRLREVLDLYAEDDHNFVILQNLIFQYFLFF